MLKRSKVELKKDEQFCVYQIIFHEYVKLFGIKLSRIKKVMCETPNPAEAVNKIGKIFTANAEGVCRTKVTPCTICGKRGNSFYECRIQTKVYGL